MALLSTFYDDFNDNTYNTSKWSAKPVNFNESGGKMNVTIDRNSAIQANTSYDAIGSEVRFDTELLPGTSIGNNWLDFGIFVGSMNTIYGFRRINQNIGWISGTTMLSSVAYDTPHRYCRIRVASGGSPYSIFWETSPDGTTWTQRNTLSTSAALGGSTPFIRVENYQGSPLGTTWSFNAVNPQSVPPAGPQVWVWDGSQKIAATAKVWDGSTKLAATPKIQP